MIFLSLVTIDSDTSTIYSLCGGEVPSTVKTIKYPESGEYLDNLHCTWTISRPGETINATVTKLDIEPGHGCKWDNLQIGSGAKMCRDMPDKKFIGHGKLSISFKSDGSNGYSGFTIKVTSAKEEG